jgi:hypothetical protein
VGLDCFARARHLLSAATTTAAAANGNDVQQVRRAHGFGNWHCGGWIVDAGSEGGCIPRPTDVQRPEAEDGACCA